MYKTKFQDSWLNRIDENGNTVSQWATKIPAKPFDSFCTICNCEFSVIKDFDKLKQHANTKKHKSNLFKIKSNQLKLSADTSKSSVQLPQIAGSARSEEIRINTTDSNKKIPIAVSLCSSQEAACRAEMLLCLDIVNSNNSLASCEGKRELFEAMFPNCIPDSFSLSRTKASYLVTHALGPYFKDLLLRELQVPNTHFSLQYDETGNVKNKKELQIRVQYWSSSQNIVVNQHLATYFIEKSDAITILKYLYKALDENNLAIHKVLVLGSDGPNVNKKVLRLFQEKLKELNYKTLLDISSCLLHSMHNAFLKGMQCLELDVSDLIIKLFYFFHNQHLRCENFKTIQSKLKLPNHTFIKHVTTRWLTIGPAAERVAEQLPALEEYFLKYVPKNESNTTKKQSYQDITKYLKNDALKTVLEFVLYTSKIFTSEFTCKMQKAEPLIHILYPQLKKLFYLLCTNIVKSSEIPKNFLDVNIEDLLQNDNLLGLKEIGLGENVKCAISLPPEKSKLYFLNSDKKFYIKSLEYIYMKSTNLQVLKNFECLSPQNIKKKSSVDCVINIAKELPLVNIDLNSLSQEWKLLQIDPDVSFNLKRDQRIDEYWHIIFTLQNSSNSRYPMITQVVKASLSIIHGSADVERGFSTSAKIMTEERANMNEKMINARLFIIDGMKRFDCKPYKVPISRELLKMARVSRQSYQAELEEKKKKIEEKKKELQESERLENEKAIRDKVKQNMKDLKQLESQLKCQEKTYKEAIKETESMESILKNSAQTVNSKVVFKELLSSLENLRNKEKEERENVDKLRKVVETKKSNLLKNVVKS